MMAIKMNRDTPHRKAAPGRQGDGFTLIEMIGVLTVIAILAGLMTPRVFKAIGDARVTALIAGYSVIRSATAAYYRDVGFLPPKDTGRFAENFLFSDAGLRSGRPATVAKWDGPYLEGLPQTAAIGEVDPVHGLTLIVGGADIIDGASDGFDFNADGVSETPASPVGSRVVMLLLRNVSGGDFLRIDEKIDKHIAPEGAFTGSFTDWSRYGKVKFTGGGADGAGDMRIYLAHK